MKCAVTLTFLAGAILVATSDADKPINYILMKDKHSTYSLFKRIWTFSPRSLYADVDEAAHSFSGGNQQFASKMYKQISKNDSVNIVFSPLSANTILAVIAEGAKGNTRDEIITALGYPKSTQQIQSWYKTFLPQLKLKGQNTTLLSANKIFASKNVDVKSEFKTVAENIYDSGVENVDFSNNIEAAGTINQWVQNRTNDKIKNLVKPEAISSATSLILVNALYLKAIWEVPFFYLDTKVNKFYRTPTETVDMPFMWQLGNYKYYYNEDLDTQFLQLSFKAKGLSMIFALPNKMDGLITLETDIEKVFASQPFKLETVKMRIPKFRIETEINMSGILKHLGVSKLFSNPDLTDLCSNSTNLYVSDVVQKAFIDVNEGGIEAAAATAITLTNRNGEELDYPQKLFNADHPFIYIIKYNDVILFTGKVTTKSLTY